MTIDDLLGNLHNDKILTIEEQLRALEREINTRRLASAEISANLFEQLRALNSDILRLQPEHPWAVDTQRVARESLEREHRQLERDLREELRNRWRDLQELGREHRQLLREWREQAQRYERHTGNYE